MGTSIHPFVLTRKWLNLCDVVETSAHLKGIAGSADELDAAAPVDTCCLIGEEQLDVIAVLGGASRGRTLRELINEAPRQIVGRQYDKAKPFPLSLTIRSIQQDQPLQLYPDQDTAAELSMPDAMNAKFWYSLAAERSARVFLGLDPRTSAHQLIRHLSGTDARNHLQRFNVRVGDSYLVLPGTVHALTSGQTVLEMSLSTRPGLRLATWSESEDIPEAELDAAIRSVNPESRQIIRMPKVRGEVSHTRKIPLTRHCPYFAAEEIRLLDHIFMETNGEACELLFALEGTFSVSHEGGRESVPENHLCLVPAALGSFKLQNDDGPAEILRFSRLPM